jgi:hypothetical protein
MLAEDEGEDVVGTLVGVTDSRFMKWRITGYSLTTPMAPRISRASFAHSRATQ